MAKIQQKTVLLWLVQLQASLLAGILFFGHQGLKGKGGDRREWAHMVFLACWVSCLKLCVLTLYLSPHLSLSLSLPFLVCFSNLISLSLSLSPLMCMNFVCFFKPKTFSNPCRFEESYYSHLSHRLYLRNLNSSLNLSVYSIVLTQDLSKVNVKF